MSLAKSINPWSVERIEDFLYFCCPICDQKNHSKDDFFHHAYSKHPESKGHLEKHIYENKDESQKIEEKLSDNTEIRVSSDFSNDGSNIKEENIEDELREEKIFMEKDSDDYNAYDYSEMIQYEINENMPSFDDMNNDKFIKEETKDNTSSAKPHQKLILPCHLCNKILGSKYALKYHIKMSHERDGQEDYKCELCGKTFFHPRNVKRHMLTRHLGEKAHKCDICGKSFSQNANLKAHIQNVHNKEKKFECGFCGNFFSQESNLKRHTKVHTGQRDHKCEICDKYFSQAEHLRKHTRKIHENNEKFDFINENGNDDNALPDISDMVACEIKTINCENCGKYFKTKSALNYHVDSVHKGLKFPCALCDKTYTRNTTLKSHMKMAHGRLPNNLILRDESHQKIEKYSEENTEMKFGDVVPVKEEYDIENAS